jgi:hypothetical protein
MRFARTEGPFSKHFDKDGNPTATPAPSPWMPRDAVVRMIQKG